MNKKNLNKEHLHKKPHLPILTLKLTDLPDENLAMIEYFLLKEDRKSVV